MVIVLRWVDTELHTHEEFIGLYEIPSIEASLLVAVVKDTFLCLNITLAKVRGQCYDGASNMAGRRSGVAKQILDEQPLAFYTHCYGHSLSLAVSDMVKNCSTMKKALDITHEITKLIKYSPRREVLFRSIKDDVSPGTPGIRVLCPTRWTVRAETMDSIIQNYSVLQEVWEKATEIVHDSDTIARIRGVESMMQTFDFFFGLTLGHDLLRNTDNLSKALQKKNFSAAEGQIVAFQTKKTLLQIRSEECFNLFWEKVNKMAVDLDIGDPQLPRKRKRPRRLEEGAAPPEFDSTPKDLYRRVYYEAIDFLVQAIADRFEQEGYEIYSCVEKVLLKAIKKEDYSEELKQVSDVYGKDLDISNLQTQLCILTANLPQDVHDIHTLISHMQKTSAAEKELICEVIRLMKIMLVMPATNASSERSFSALRRLKTYLRSTMTQKRLNNLLILHVHKDRTDDIPLSEVLNDFVSKGERRSHVFGKLVH